MEIGLPELDAVGLRTLGAIQGRSERRRVSRGQEIFQQKNIRDRGQPASPATPARLNECFSRSGGKKCADSGNPNVMEIKPKKHCIPCEAKTTALKGNEITFRLMGLPAWHVIDEHHIVKVFNFKDFKSALAFVNEIGRIAEEEQHHPDIFLSWGKVEVKLFTHSVNGLSENDFVMAEMIEGLLEKAS